MLETVVQLISTVGFPIACSVAMFAMWDRERETHDAEVKEITKAITNNSLILQKLLDKLGASEGGVTM